MSGIYKIQNKITNDLYIGSTKDFNHRKYTHFSLLDRNKHHSKILQRSYNKHGKRNFIFKIVETCNIHELLELEQFYLDLFNPRYNISKYAYSPMKGRKHNKNTLKKMSGKIPWNKGIPRTIKEKKKMSKNRKIAHKKMNVDAKRRWINKLKNQVGYWKNKNMPESSKYKISEHWRRILKPIKCSNGKIYSTQLDAAIDLNIRQGHISEHLNKKRISVKGFKFNYV